MLKKVWLRSILLLGLLFAGHSYAAEYAVIVHKDNKVSESEAESIGRIRELFLKNRSSWVNGPKAKAYSRSIGSPIQKAFIKNVLSMSEEDFAQHWLLKKQVTGEVAPRAVASDRSIIKLVSKYQGAFAVIEMTSADKLPEDVKILFKFSD